MSTNSADVEPLLWLDHNGRMGMRALIDPKAYARFEGGTAPVASRVVALWALPGARYEQ